MLKLETERGEIRSMVVAGTVIDITADVLLIIKTIYENLEEVAEDGFKEAITNLLPTCFMTEEERKELLKKEASKGLEEIGNKIKKDGDDCEELLNVLEELKKVIELKKAIFEVEGKEDETFS